MQTNAAEELRYKRYRVHLRILDKVPPRLKVRFRDGHVFVRYVSKDLHPSARKLDTVFRFKNRLLGGY